MRNRILLLLALTCFLSACGQRGPLFLPEQSDSNQPVEQTESEESDKDSDASQQPLTD